MEVRVCLWNGALASFLLLVSSCFRSDLSDRFQSGAGKQDDLNSRTLELWERSPSADTGNDALTANDNLDALVPRVSVFFSDLLDLRTELRGPSLQIFRSYQDRSAPSFFEWAGRYMPWHANPDFRVFRAFQMADANIVRIEAMIADGDLPAATDLSWKQDLGLSQKTLPLNIYADGDLLPNGVDAYSSDSGYCPMVNTSFRSNASQVCPENPSECWCLDRSLSSWQSLRAQGKLGKAVFFFKESIAPVARFNPVDDADSFHSIFGRVLLDAVRADIAEQPPGFNADMDAVMSGLTDFFAAAMVRDDRLYRYTFANYKLISPTSFLDTVTPSSRQRDPANALYFPDASLYSIQLGGRVVSGALNDLRRLVSGSSVTAPRGGACAGSCANENLSGTKVFSPERAWDKVLGLAYSALQDDAIDENSTHHAYAKALIRTCRARSWCAGQQNNFRTILEARGLLSRRSFQNLSGDYAIRDEALPVDGSAVVDDQSTTYALLKIGGDARRHGLVLQETLGWAPVRAPAAAEFADADSLMEPCELIYIFPRLVNNTNDDWWGETDSVAPPGSDPAYPTKVPNWATVSKWKRGLDILDIEVELKSISGAQQIMEFQENLKVLPWLSPGEDTQVLVRDSQSRFYREQQDARFETFSGSLSTSTVAVYASKLGWLIKAPANTGASATTIAAQFQVRFQAYNLDKIIPGAGGLFFDGTFDGDGKENAYSTFTQYIDVDGEDDGGTSFCQ